MHEPQGITREMVILALYQVTGKGIIFTIAELKAMTNSELGETWEHYSNMKLIRSKG